MSSQSTVLFYTTGLPGSGKTTFSSELAQKLGIIHLYADEIGLDIFRIPKFTPEERKYLYSEIDWQAQNHLKNGKSIIYDANINSLKLRNHLRNLAKKENVLAVGLWLNTPGSLAFERFKRPKKIRGVILLASKGGGDSLYAKFKQDYKPPIRERFIIEIDGTIPFSEQFRVFSSRYKEILLEDKH